MDYATLGSLLGEAETTREALLQAARRHEQENLGWRSAGK
jgi:hypothetical protein